MDEGRAAVKINEYLMNDYFGHKYLRFEPEKDKTPDQKIVRFNILRGSEIAYNLSEGECSLIAFCYFLAKLEDAQTTSHNPIILIDDPISSLDGNHIFFIYSLIKSVIVDPHLFEQLFITTHNLDFLKYLKRLNIPKNKSAKTECKKAYFLISRKHQDSEVLPMPKYLKTHITEFNYLFDQIYNCSLVESPDDSNYHYFYNFGNNARRFMDIYLFYKYPDNESCEQHRKKFFAPDAVPDILIERLTNEYSHSQSTMERSSMPTEVAEMHSAAILICDKIKDKDEDQYESLLASIGRK